MKGEKSATESETYPRHSAAIVLLARGIVLEIGVGPGVNFVHYDPATVNKVYAIVPNSGMLRCAEEERRRERALKPGGKLIFFEHGRSPDLQCVAGKSESEPLFDWAFEGCHVTRDIPFLIGKGSSPVAPAILSYLESCRSYFTKVATG